MGQEGRSSIYASVFNFGKNAVNYTFICSCALEIIRSLFIVEQSPLFSVFLC